MLFPDDLKYTESHEWLKVDGDVAVVGITAFAAGELGDVVFVDIPELRTVAKGESFGSIEAVKTVSDLIAPIAGELKEKNAELEGAPDLVNGDPYGAGWMVKMSVSDMAEVDGLLTAAQYKALIGKD
jgi:glycine cleavage system H protein